MKYQINGNKSNINVKTETKQNESIYENFKDSDCIIDNMNSQSVSVSE